MPYARVISGAVIVSDDCFTQFKYKERCPHCGALSGEHYGVALPGSPFVERSVCPECGRPFEVKIERD